MNKKEIYWLIGTAISALLIHFSIDGFNTFTSFSALDINIHDTYFVIPNIQFFMVLITFIFFVVYLTRMLKQNFKNFTANLIFIISNITLISILTFLILLINSLRRITETTEQPALSSGIVKNAENDWNGAFYFLIIIQLVLIILLTFSGIKTGLNYKQKK